MNKTGINNPLGEEGRSEEEGGMDDMQTTHKEEEELDLAIFVTFVNGSMCPSIVK